MTKRAGHIRKSRIPALRGDDRKMKLLLPTLPTFWNLCRGLFKFS
jgi:hypothetical protein